MIKTPPQTVIDGIHSYHPNQANAKLDYPPEIFEKLFSSEAIHFWFRSRSRIIQYFFRRFLGDRRAKILEVGCGTGFVLSGLSRFKNYELFGAELHLEGLKFAKKRLPHAQFFQIDFRETPFEEEFDAIGAFDVLEHIEEDSVVTKNIFTSLKKGGLFFATVPQHPWLWSNQDKAAGHKRRYTKKELFKKISEAGFHICHATSFVSILLPLMFLSRMKEQKMTPHSNHEYSYHELYISPMLNKVLEFFMKIEEFFIRKNISLPWGGSLLIVARKP